MPELPGRCPPYALGTVTNSRGTRLIIIVSLAVLGSVGSVLRTLMRTPCTAMPAMDPGAAHRLATNPVIRLEAGRTTFPTTANVAPPSALTSTGPPALLVTRTR